MPAQSQALSRNSLTHAQDLVDEHLPDFPSQTSTNGDDSIRETVDSASSSQIWYKRARHEVSLSFRPVVRWLQLPRVERMISLGLESQELYLRTRKLEHLEMTIMQFQSSIDKTPVKHSSRARQLYNVGVCLRERFRRLAALKDLDEAIRVTEKAVEIARSDDFSRMSYLESLCEGYHERYSETQILADLDKAIRLGRDVIRGIPTLDQARWKRLNRQAILCEKKFSRTDLPEDLDKAIQYGNEAISNIPRGDSTRAVLLNSLATRVFKRHLKAGVERDREEALRLLQEAVDTGRNDNSERAKFLANLSKVFRKKWLDTKSTEYLDQAISSRREAVDAMPTQDAQYEVVIDDLSALLAEGFSDKGALDDLAEAIQIKKQLLSTNAEDDPRRVLWLCNLSVYFAKQHDVTQAPADVEEAVRLAQQAADFTPKNHQDRNQVLTNLGVHLSKRLTAFGKPEDLKQALRVTKEAVDNVADGCVERESWLHNYGMLLFHRFEQTGALADLDGAVQILQQIVDATSENDADRPMRLANLGNLLYIKFERTRMLSLLEEAIRLTREAVALSRKSRRGQERCVNLAELLSQRFMRSKVISDIEEAIQITREILNSTPKDDPFRVKVMCRLGSYLGSRYKVTGAIGDINAAIDTQREAFCIPLENEADKIRRFFDHAKNLTARSGITGSKTDSEEACRYFVTFARHSTMPLISRIKAGHAALRVSAVDKHWQQAFEASKIAIPLVSKLLPRSLENTDKQYMLSQLVFGLGSDAAAAALYADQGALVALENLEQARGALAASLQELRIDIADLYVHHPGLAEKFKLLRDELQLSLHEDTPALEGSDSLQGRMSRRHEIGDEFDSLINEIHTKPGFERFLLAPDKSAICHAASCGPIVVVNVSRFGCDAILIEQYQIRSIHLPDLESTDIGEKVVDAHLGSRRVLEWLWDVIARPVLNALGFTKRPPGNSWPHVWWVPTGLLSKFPLHAAGKHYRDSCESVLDRVMSSYSPSVKAIIYGRRRRTKSAKSSKALLVAMEDTPGQPRLPFATAEVAVLTSLLEKTIEPGRCKKDIALHLQECNIFHFAGHGYTDIADPSQSQLCLTDWNENPFTVASLLEMNTGDNLPVLAYLSACGTGRVSRENFIDESIHLVGAFQLAGFRHVIGTLWEVNDKMCVEMVRVAYQIMIQAGFTDESICLGLHMATRELRERWLDTSEDKSQDYKATRRVEEDQGSVAVRMQRVSHESDKDNILGRDATFVSEDGGQVEPLYWVPYIHFGV